MKLLYLIFLLQIGFYSCDNESGIEFEEDISGTWEVVSLHIDGTMKVLNPSDNPLNKDIQISIPDSSEGIVSGNTFQNTIFFDIKVTGKTQITCTNYGGTRIAEDEWGIAFQENILQTSNFSIKTDTLFFTNENDLKFIKFIKKPE